MRSPNILHMPALDHLRLLAALLVFAFHVFHFYFGQWQPTPYAAAFGLVTEGHTGVSLFFVLSGFLFMCIGMQDGDIRYWAFLRNRFLRIFPLFVFFFFVSISIGRDEFRAADILYLFFSNLGQAPTSNSFITGAAWTISVEFTFYLVFPFLASFVRAEGWIYLLRLICLMALVKLAAYGVSIRSTHMFYSTLVGRFDQFLWGMLAAALWHQHTSLFRQHGRLLLALALGLVWSAVAYQAHYASYFLPQPKQFFWVFWGTLEAVLWAAVVLGYLSAQIAWPNAVSQALSRGGEYSYSFYLWHGMLIYTVHHYLGSWMPFDTVALNALGYFLILLPMSLCLAAFSCYTIERPFLALRQTYISGNSAATTTVG